MAACVLSCMMNMTFVKELQRLRQHSHCSVGCTASIQLPNGTLELVSIFTWILWYTLLSMYSLSFSSMGSHKR